ncbi:hypothetical protein BHM03_00055143 [Ensete ventricosum]|nr:hypothetical protein BHM03_00055143 [Ensete ventricosum]
MTARRRPPGGVAARAVRACAFAETKQYTFAESQQDGVVEEDSGLRNFQREECKEESCFNRTDVQEG